MFHKLLKSTALLAVAFMGFLSCDKMPQEQKVPERPEKTPGKYIYVQGRELLLPDKSRFEMRGVNLAGWLSPDGRVIGLDSSISEREITSLLFQIAGPGKTAAFWSSYKANFVTKADIEFIASCGANTVRVPFDWRLFSDRDFMGLTVSQDGFAILDNLFTWCNETGLYVILTMQSAPGGQSGDESDNGFAYPFLMDSREAQTEFANVWKKIAEHFKNEKRLLGYELMDAPVYDCTQFQSLGTKVEALSRKAVKSIRSVDANHTIILDGIHSGTDFSCYEDFEFDDNILYAGKASSPDVLSGFLHFREYSTGLPLLVVETSVPASQTADVRIEMDRNGFGYAFSPYKSSNGSNAFLTVPEVAGWSKVKSLSDAPRNSIDEIHALKFSLGEISSALDAFVDACRIENCQKNQSFIKSTGFTEAI